MMFVCLFQWTMDVDPKYEYINAPQFVDFEHLDRSATDHDKYFGKCVYLQMCISPTWLLPLVHSVCKYLYL